MKSAIRVDKISKQYRLGLSPNKDNNLTENLRMKARHTWDKIHRLLHPHKEHHEDESFWALKDVSFEVKPGEVVGIIGRNGAGKSTLLKILTQVVEPTSGYAEVRGRMGSLLEVGTGFHPELTGRENIYLNGSILGMSKKEIDKKFDEIVAFSEIEKFLDVPVKRYSSGMYVRLAFAVAAHLEPEILIVDEVLAVGDAQFQKKCLGKMSEVSHSGRTVLFVSHNIDAVRTLCRRGLFIENGQLKLSGPCEEVIERYLAQFGSRKGGHPFSTSQDTSKPQLTEFRMRNPQGEPTSTIPFLSAARLDFTFTIPKRISMKPLHFLIRLIRADGLQVGCVTSRETPCSLIGAPGEYGVSIELPKLSCLPGCYSWTYEFRIDGEAPIIGKYENLADFEISPKLLPGAIDAYNQNHGISFIDANISTQYIPSENV